MHRNILDSQKKWLYSAFYKVNISFLTLTPTDTSVSVSWCCLMTDIINNTSHCAVSRCLSRLMCRVTQKTYFSFAFLFLMIVPKLPFTPVQAVWNVNSARWWGRMLLSAHILYQTRAPTRIHKQRGTHMQRIRHRALQPKGPTSKGMFVHTPLEEVVTSAPH